MRLAPAGIIDLLLEKVLERYVDFHKLPKDQTRAISCVLSEVAKQAIVYREKFGHIIVRVSNRKYEGKQNHSAAAFSSRTHLGKLQSTL